MPRAVSAVSGLSFLVERIHKSLGLHAERRRELAGCRWPRLVNAGLEPSDRDAANTRSLSEFSLGQRLPLAEELQSTELHHRPGPDGIWG